MSSAVPQTILDALTNVPMPTLPPSPGTSQHVSVGGRSLPLYQCGTLVVGSGAAGLRAAVELKRRSQDVLIATMAPYGGTSACSGSDKQTLHTAGTSNKGDDFIALAQTLAAGGCMDGDLAYIEAVGSLHTLAGLQYLGLPLPQDRFGAVLRYQTDHDTVGRATSCGPRTSRLMVQVLAREAVALQIPILRKCEVVSLLVDHTAAGSRICGALAIDQERRDQNHGFIVIQCPNVVLANGGPGELYRDSVYPAHCYGGLGLALEAGVSLCNLTESQFGIGTRRSEFPWNLSGTYVQVMPYVFSRDETGKEYNFLADYYRTTQELVSNVFRKGYQWPFHATRMLDYGSSLVDLAIAIESQRGRTVYLDFTRNPLPGADGLPFSLDKLDSDVALYLRNNEVSGALPIDRLRTMNPLAIELYRMHGHDLTTEPLPFNVNNQHMNGGVDIDAWFESSLAGCFAIGEVAGSHGVTRPGGAALNAGQVAGVRVADQIASRANLSYTPDFSPQIIGDIGKSIEHAVASLSNSAGIAVAALREEIQSRMSDYAGFLCHVEQIAEAQAAASALREHVIQRGIRIERPAQLIEVFRWRHLAFVSEAVLLALRAYTDSGGGSRGARAYLSANGDQVPQSRLGALDMFRFRSEKERDKHEKIVVQWQQGQFVVKRRPLRCTEDPGEIYFEKNWSAYLTGQIYGSSYRHHDHMLGQ